MLTRLPPPRSSAALAGAAHSDTARTILAALVLNLVVASAKLVAGLLSGSAALLAEAGHSLADSLNEVLLGIAVRRERVPADPAHPLGHGREHFLWAFMAAIASFLIGRCLSIGLAIREIVEGGSTDSVLGAWAVLGVAFAADGMSLVQSLREARREARQHGQALWQYLLRVSDPALRTAVPEVADVYVDVTADRSEPVPTDRPAGRPDDLTGAARSQGGVA